MAVKDMTGLRFGKLLVIERDTTVPYAAAYWRCKCDCGKEKTVRGQSLRDGSVTDCGCGKAERIRANIDKTSLIGKQFGRLTVVERDLTKPIGHGCVPYWVCQCECGKIKSILASSLKSGRTRSCGCLSSELKSQRSMANIANERFGKLIALEQTDEKNHGSYIWKCRCDCGNIVFATTERLRAGHTSSCGCETRSKGEQKIAALLTEAKISYSFQQSFKDCRNPKTNAVYFFDFAILQDNQIVRLIEFDGIQHFEKFEHHPFFNYDYIHFNDQQKNQYAKEKQIPLIRIPYTQLNELTLEDIMGDKYLI